MKCSVKGFNFIIGHCFGVRKVKFSKNIANFETFHQYVYNILSRIIFIYNTLNNIAYSENKKKMINQKQSFFGGRK